MQIEFCVTEKQCYINISDKTKEKFRTYNAENIEFIKKTIKFISLIMETLLSNKNISISLKINIKHRKIGTSVTVKIQTL